MTPFGVSTNELVLLKSCYLNKDIITDTIATTAKIIKFLLCAI